MSNRVPMNVARIGGFDAEEFYAIVTEPILVTFNSSATLPWRCEVHGRHVRPTCEHERAAQSRARKAFPRNTKEN